MFDIEYKGGNSIIISTRKINLVFDPNRSSFGLKDIIEKDGAEIATEKRFLTNSSEYRTSIEGPGEYEVSDVAIKGIAAFRHIDDPKSALMEGNIYRISIDNIKIAILGNIHPDVDESQLDELGHIDILIIPVGGSGYTLDATSAVSLTRKIDPKIVIPTHFDDSSLNYEVPQDKIDTFIGEMKATVCEVDKKIKIKSDADLPDVLEIYKTTYSK